LPSFSQGFYERIITLDYSICQFERKKGREYFLYWLTETSQYFGAKLRLCRAWGRTSEDSEGFESIHVLQPRTISPTGQNSKTECSEQQAKVGHVEEGVSVIHPAWVIFSKRNGNQLCWTTTNTTSWWSNHFTHAFTSEPCQRPTRLMVPHADWTTVRMDQVYRKKKLICRDQTYTKTVFHTVIIPDLALKRLFFVFPSQLAYFFLFFLSF